MRLGIGAVTFCLVVLASSRGLAAQTAVEASAAEQPFTDMVGTLELSEPLDARGQLGGVTVDRLGFIYVANFRDAVWRISPEGEVATLARSLYGSSGNAVDSRGDLFQANFFGNTISRIAREGTVTRFVDRGLQGPVGIAIDGDDTLYVCNCNGNYLSKVTRDGEVETLVGGDLFACPNGIVFGPDEHLYVTNFNNHDIIRVSKAGEAEVFTTSPGGAGNAHITFAKGFFYVTKILSNTLVKISAEDGELFPLAGTGAAGHGDGPAPEATLAHPNGITASPAGDVLYFNTVDGTYNGGEPTTLRVRTVELLTLTDVLDRAQQEGGVEALRAAYERYSSDPVRGRENTVAEMVAYGYRHLSSGRIAEAQTIFALNAEAHPDVAAAQYQLGEFYRYTGQTEAAIEQYEKALAIDPDHPQAPGRIAQLGADQAES